MVSRYTFASSTSATSWPRRSYDACASRTSLAGALDAEARICLYVATVSAGCVLEITAAWGRRSETDDKRHMELERVLYSCRMTENHKNSYSRMLGRKQTRDEMVGSTRT